MEAKDPVGARRCGVRQPCVCVWWSCPGEAFNDLWCFNPELRRWRPISARNADAPSPHRRGGHSATVVEGRYMYVFGGNTLDVSSNDVWRIDLRACFADSAADWEEVKPKGKTHSVRASGLSTSPWRLVIGCTYTAAATSCPENASTV